MSYARTTISASAKQIRTSTLPAVRAVPRIIRGNREKVSQAETVVKTNVSSYRMRGARAARIAAVVAPRPVAIVVAPRPAQKMKVVTPNEVRITSVPQHRTKKAGKSLLKVREQVYAKADDMRMRWMNMSDEDKLELSTELNTQLPLGPINEERKCMGLPAVVEPADKTKTHSKLRFVADDKLNRVHPIVSRHVGVYEITDADLTQSEIDRIATAKLAEEIEALLVEDARLQTERRIEDARDARIPVFVFTPPSPKKTVILTSSGLPGGLYVPSLNRYGRLDNEDDYEEEEEQAEQAEQSDWEKVVEEFKWEIVADEDLYETY